MSVDQNDPSLWALFKMLEEKFEAERIERGIPGLSAALVHDQDIIWSKGFGYANVEDRIPADPQTIYRVGSITKLFTATMLMQLRDAGKLSLDDPVEKYVPSFRLKNHFSDPSAPTFRQLASHTAGIPREAPVGTWQSDGAYPPIENVLASLQDAEMIFPPLTEIKYSNLGYAILGYALAQIAHEPYEQYVTERILKRLGMNNSGFELTDEMKPHAAIGYAVASGQSLERAPDPQFGALIPAGALYSSVTDLTHFVALQFRDGAAGGKQILKGSTLREMQAPVLLDADWQRGFGIGWELTHLVDQSIITHNGAATGFLSDLFIAPRMKLGLVVSANAQMDVVVGLARRIFEAIIPVTNEAMARQAQQPQQAQADWSTYVGQYSIPGIMEVDVVIVDGKLAVSIPAGSPPNVFLIPEGVNAFRSKGGIVNGELAVFEMNSDGQVARIKAGRYVLERKP